MQRFERKYYDPPHNLHWERLEAATDRATRRVMLDRDGDLILRVGAGIDDEPAVDIQACSATMRRMRRASPV
jgi:hypothetical protein